MSVFRVIFSVKGLENLLLLVQGWLYVEIGMDSCMKTRSYIIISITANGEGWVTYLNITCPTYVRQTSYMRPLPVKVKRWGGFFASQSTWLKGIIRLLRFLRWLLVWAGCYFNKSGIEKMLNWRTLGLCANKLFWVLIIWDLKSPSVCFDFPCCFCTWILCFWAVWSEGVTAAKRTWLTNAKEGEKTKNTEWDLIQSNTFKMYTLWPRHKSLSGLLFHLSPSTKKENLLELIIALHLKEPY